jgi:hypothetical protein
VIEDRMVDDEGTGGDAKTAKRVRAQSREGAIHCVVLPIAV